jgi:spermidine synthase
MKSNWFYEDLYPDDVKLGLKVKRNLYSGRSKFQKIKFIDTYRFGKTLILDGVIQTTTVDEFIYHEMMTHVPMLSHPNPEDVLIIGGGDGGILREVLKYDIKSVTLVEIDEKVIQFSKKYLKEIEQNSFNDKRLNLVIDDGAKFIKGKKKAFDVVIIDSPDPIGPAEVLFSEEFYRDVSDSLKKGGVVSRQSGSTFLQDDEVKDSYLKLKKVFKYTFIYTAAIPTYIGGLFSFIYASHKINPTKIPLRKLEERFKKVKGKTRYYNPEIHLASFKLPNYLKELVGEK